MRKVFICFIFVFLFIACNIENNLPPNLYDPVSPWGITYDGENLWVTDDDLSMIYKLDLELDLKDSFALSKGYLRGITSHDDGLWIVSDSSVGNAIVGDSISLYEVNVYYIYEIDKSNGMIIDSIRVQASFSNTIEGDYLLGIVSFNSYLYVSYNGGFGPCMFEINPQSKEVVRSLCCAHPLGMTVINDTLWCARDGSVILVPIRVFDNETNEIDALRYELGFQATDLAYDGENVWVVDRGSSLIRKITDLR
jgi:hypothetical protein